jgi:hypothetical protein
MSKAKLIQGVLRKKAPHQLQLKKLSRSPEHNPIEAARQAAFKQEQQARILGKMGLTPEKYDKLFGSEKIKVARRMMDETPKDWTAPPENMIKPSKYQLQDDHSPDRFRESERVRRRLKGRGSSRRG